MLQARRFCSRRDVSAVQWQCSSQHVVSILFSARISKDTLRQHLHIAFADLNSCHLGYSNNNGDACGSGSSYGLCGVTGTQLWRESCTDPTWKSASCLKLCINGTG